MGTRIADPIILPLERLLLTPWTGAGNTGSFFIAVYEDRCLNGVGRATRQPLNPAPFQGVDERPSDKSIVIQKGSRKMRKPKDWMDEIIDEARTMADNVPERRRSDDRTEQEVKALEESINGKRVRSALFTKRSRTR